MTLLRSRLSPLIVLALAVACGDTREPTAPGADDALLGSASAPGAAADHWHATLSGGAERPTPVESRARGHAQFWLADDGSAIEYRLNVANLNDLHMAHIHLGSVDEAGPVVVWLYPESGPPPQPKPGRTSGVLATGTITASDLTGPLATQPLSALITAIDEDRTYVNVHTSANPGGEIRGQIR